jgi:uncharacterized protein (DUF58 family)
MASQPQVDWAAVRAAAAFRLAVPRAPIGGRLGERLGAGTGSSLEFQDYRQYAPGDDLRHVDWAAYARSDVLTVRLYREEVAPRIDMIVDASRSMAVNERKHRAHLELVGLLACACAGTGADTRVVTSPGTQPATLTRPEEIERLVACDTGTSALEAPHLPLRRRSLRLVVSDFLFPHDADALINRLARDGAWLGVVQLTLPDEAEPTAEGARRLRDVEDGVELDLMIDERAVNEYRKRFTRLRAQLSGAARRVGAPYAHLLAGVPPRTAARALAGVGMLEPI